ncbi:DNA-directed RNA polymerase specialized sigma24 family protein [Salinibacter ruber]|uniref:hypothetical protein n=1 Tax=Salinibacter ruber TaxID=146919 RepID=UPI002167ADC0|nr:hypothetical protein [Salinibacter ruber]MCS3707200.1 DNA-directed RNA polymerase specialized sigma24 family protein [Salinibacter ruber]
MIEQLRALRDRALRAFNTPIDCLEPDPYDPPTPRDEQLEQERQELRQLFEELHEVQQGVLCLLEERRGPDAPYDSIESFVDDLDISDEGDHSET